MAKTKKITIEKKITNLHFTFSKPDCNSELIMNPKGDVEVLKNEKSSPANYIQRKMSLMNEIYNFMRSFEVAGIAVEAVEEIIKEEREVQVEEE